MSGVLWFDYCWTVEINTNIGIHFNTSSKRNFVVHFFSSFFFNSWCLFFKVFFSYLVSKAEMMYK